MYVYIYIYIYIYIYVYIYLGNITFVVIVFVEENSEVSQTFKIYIFAKIVKGFKLSTICTRTPF